MHLDNHQILCTIARMSQFCCLTLWFQGVKNRLNFKHADNCVLLTGLHLKNPCVLPIRRRAQHRTPQSHSSLWAEQKALVEASDRLGTGLSWDRLGWDRFSWHRLSWDGQQRRLSAWPGVCRRRGRQKDPLTWWAWGRHAGEQHPPRSLLAAGAAHPVGISQQNVKDSCSNGRIFPRPLSSPAKHPALPLQKTHFFINWQGEGRWLCN